MYFTKKIINTNNICEYDNPIFTITKEELKFNKKKYDSILSIKGSLIIKSDSLITEIQHDLYGITDLKTNLTKWINYHDNGNISSVAFFLRDSSSSEIGLENYYNELCNLIKTIDHEKGYKIWAEAIEIIKQKLKNSLSKYDSVEYILQRVDLIEFPNEKPMWSIGIVPEPDDKIGETTYYKIDGVTGKYLGKYTLRMGK